MKVEQVPLHELTPHPRNIRRGDIAAIQDSLKVHGQYRPIVVQKATGLILAGNHTFKAAQNLSWHTIAVTKIDVDDDEALRILLVDNRTNDLASYDDAELAGILRELVETELKLEGTGYTIENLDELVAGLDEPVKVLGDPDEVPEVTKEVSKVGDVWLLGPHRVMCGDSTAMVNVEKLMNGAKADMVFTDPPYGVSYVGKTKRSLTIKNDDEGGLSKMLLAAFQCAISACVEGGGLLLCGPAGAAEFAIRTNAGLARNVQAKTRVG